ncbi:MAG TPA: hypothetical protein VH108_01460 [Gaiellaceae bacterium]|jgi:hypothetical protein|nr:hypothetical protein [Gaiellaceae bacterium]
MSVQISDLDVVPRPTQAPQGQQPQQQGSGQGAPSPEQAREIARTVSLLKARDLRLHAD